MIDVGGGDIVREGDASVASSQDDAAGVVDGRAIVCIVYAVMIR